MKNSRLLRLLLLLQTRGRLTAPQLAAELEVSVRTVLRDVDQLSAAGVPVWGQPGRHSGGFQLQAGWSTQLTGLTQDEAQALWLAGLPQAAAELGLGAAAASARLKLLAGVPRDVQDSSQRVAQRLHLDPLDWYRAPDQPRFLRELAQAVWQGRRVAVRYVSWTGERQRLLDPLGLVLKAGAWYLVALAAGAKAPRTYRLASVQTLALREEACQRPPDFDLPRFWRDSSARFEAGLRRFSVRLRATPLGRSRLLNARLPHAQQADGSLLLGFEDEDMAARQLLQLGAEVEVLEPGALRERLAALAEAVLRRYRSG
jgi:predicted DNA-binding transcriptional regulator YafY